MILIEEVLAGQVWSTHISLWMNLDGMTNATGEVLLELATVTVVVYGPLHFSLMAGDIFATKEAHFDFSGLPCHTRMDLRVHNITKKVTRKM